MKANYANNKLALFGGTPVRPTKKSANPIITSEAKKDVLSVLDSGALAMFYGGTNVKKFEELYAKWFGRKYAVAVNSGTAALHLIYLALNLPEGSEVLVPANAYVSAVSALIQANLIPVIVDVDSKSWVMNVEDCRKKITPNTSAIVAVHMYGQPCPMTEIKNLAEENNLILIEDCGQSHGALWNGQKTGTFGHAAAFSLCCRKHIAMGEGGIIITDDEKVAARARSLAHKGKGEGWLDYWEMGYSYNMTEIQATLGIHQLNRLEQELSQRKKMADLGRARMAETGLIFPEIPENSTHAYFKLNALVPEKLTSLRNEIVNAIRDENVGCDPCHPHLLDIKWIREYEPYFLRNLPPTKKPNYGMDVAPIARSILSREIGIEIGPGLDDNDLEYTIKAVVKVMNYYNKESYNW